MRWPSGKNISSFQEVKELCKSVEGRFHAPILRSCKHISDCLQKHDDIAELPIPVVELLQLLFPKLQDELTHVFLKESGIVFPWVVAWQRDSVTTGINPSVIKSLQQTQHVIMQLLQKIRQLLHNYISHPQWPVYLRSCVNELFLLETRVHRWIHFEQNTLFPHLMKAINE